LHSMRFELDPLYAPAKHQHPALIAVAAGDGEFKVEGAPEAGPAIAAALDPDAA